MKIPFVKMSGAGNDFVVIDLTDESGTPEPPELPALVRAMCNRRSGIGADGVIILSPAENAGFTMRYFNADGSSGSLCGNGGRCAASYMMGKAGVGSIAFLTCGTVYHAARRPGGVLLGMDEPSPMRMDVPLSVGNGIRAGHFIDTGSPHLVIPLPGKLPDSKEVLELGRELRYSPEFRPGGTNVDFIREEGEDLISIRTYERGVEDETWACGTGAVAAAMVYSVLRGGEGERSVGVLPLSGEKLTVRFRRTGTRFTEVSLEGPAVVTFTGTYHTEH